MTASMQVVDTPIDDVVVNFRLRSPSDKKVFEIAESINQIGSLINPITIDKHNNLLAGFHRFLAYKKADIKNKEYDTDGNELDKHGFKVKKYPDGLESVRKSVDNCTNLCGLYKRFMEELLKGECSECSTLNSVGRQSKKIVIESDIQHKKDA